MRLPPLNSIITGTSLTAAALCVLLVSNILNLNAARGGFNQALQQQIMIERSQKIETQLEALATGTQALAASGNPNAQKIVGILQQNGININRGAGR